MQSVRFFEFVQLKINNLMTEVSNMFINFMHVRFVERTINTQKSIRSKVISKITMILMWSKGYPFLR